MEILRLPLEIQQVFNEAEKSIKEKYLDVVRKLPNEELKNFRKANYRDIMIEEMKEELNGIVSEDIIKSSCHYMSNALNNESIRQFSQRKRQKELGKVKSPIRTRHQTVKHAKDNNNTETEQTKTNLPTNGVDIENLSDSLDELFITQNEPLFIDPQESQETERQDISIQEDLDDSVTTVKNVASIETDMPATQDPTDKNSTNSSKTKDKKTRKGKKNGKSTQNNNTCVCSSDKPGDMIRCNLCQI